MTSPPAKPVMGACWLPVEAGFLCKAAENSRRTDSDGQPG